jgi:hypothetical protein
LKKSQRYKRWDRHSNFHSDCDVPHVQLYIIVTQTAIEAFDNVQIDCSTTRVGAGITVHGVTTKMPKMSG